MESSLDILVLNEDKFEWWTTADYDGVIPPHAVLANRGIYETNDTYKEATKKRLLDKVAELRREYEQQ